MNRVLKKEQPILVIGIGAGYHIQKLAESYPNQKIIAIEFNDSYYIWFKNSNLNLASLKNIEIESFGRLSKEKQKDLFTAISSTNIGIHKSGLDIFPPEYSSLLQLIKDLQFHQRTVLHQLDLLEDNFAKNLALKDPNLQELRNVYNGKAMIMVAAGPSLNKQLPLLHSIRFKNKFIIGAVGTAVKPLLAAGITPDFFMVTDPKEATLTQLSDVSIPEAKFLYLSTACHKTIQLHNGERYIVYQEGYPEAEAVAKKINSPLIQTGGSVATALLDTMNWMGAKAVAVIGQDLAYTNGMSHAENSHLKTTVKMTPNQLQVENYYKDGMVYTSENLSIYRKWFEKYVMDNTNLSMYNCTEGGANIKGWSNIPLDEYIKMNNN
nr:6-hydroxymethylpterin diphosphokinase MptE-like protein [Sporosarcina cyprini]